MKNTVNNQVKIINDDQQYKKESFSDISWKIKSIILISMLIMPVGCHYMKATLSTLKTTLKQNMDINNTQFSILMTSVTLVNTILALIAGIFADDFSSNAIGTIRGTLVVTIIIFIGSLVTTVGAQHLNFNLMLAGQIIFGLGDCVIVTFQETILSRWFRDKQLSIVWGLMLSIARLTKFVAKICCYPLAGYANDFTKPIVLSTIFCAISVGANLIYWVAMAKSGLASKYGKELYCPKSYHQQQQQQQEYNLYRICKSLLYLPGIFWMIPWIELTLSSVLSSFDNVSTEFIQFKFTFSSITAGYKSSFIQLVPIIVAPLSGIFIDRFGHRLNFLMAGAMTTLTGIIMLQYTHAAPLIGIIFISFTFALSSVGIMSSCALLLPTELVGVGIGLKKASNNIGTTIISILVGYIQDLTFHDGNVLDDIWDERYQYDYVMIFFIVVTVISIILIIIFWYLDRTQLNGWLQANKKERSKRFEQAQDKEGSHSLKLIGCQLNTKKSYSYIGIFLFWLLMSWIIFFVFALMPIYQNYSI